MRVALTTSRSSSSSNAVRVRSLSDSADIAGWMASSFGWWGLLLGQAPPSTLLAANRLFGLAVWGCILGP